jgi:hypothetical protein
MEKEELAEEMGVNLFCDGCGLMPTECICGFTEEDFKIHPEKKLAEPKETLCSDCGQLRLNYIGATECGNCGSKNIKVGEVGELKK